MPTDRREQLLDYFLNGWEHEPTTQSAVAQLLLWNFPERFAREIVARWEKDRPDLYPSIFLQQWQGEALINDVAAECGYDLDAGRRGEDVYKVFS